tara:strand:- start:30226 stop:30393 length:168 start_codon:yes stop_codon:yes gene_type:complete
MKNTNNQFIAKKIADKFTDTFSEQINDYLAAYNLDVNEDNYDMVIEEIVNIYKNN